MNETQRELRDWFEREQVHPRQSVIEALKSLNLRRGDRVADIGCGPGVHLPHILKRVGPDGQVVGIDTSRERLQVARAMLQREIEQDRISLVEGDMYNIDPDLGPFDVVWMSLVLHHEDVPVETIGSLIPLLAPGGRIAILDGDDAASFPFLPWSPDFELTVREAVNRAADEKRFTARRVLSVLRKAGLSDLRLRAFSDVRHAPLDGWDLDDIREWFLNSFGSRIRKYLSPADWQRYESYFSSPDDPDYLLDRPGFFLTRTWFLAEGTLK
ncbi:MAG: methyltransferase domain-containing protein [Thermomicrobiales bacterium]